MAIAYGQFYYIGLRSVCQQLIIFAIEVENVSSFSEECTPEVERAIPLCVEMVIEELNEG